MKDDDEAEDCNTDSDESTPDLDVVVNRVTNKGVKKQGESQPGHRMYAYTIKRSYATRWMLAS